MSVFLFAVLLLSALTACAETITAVSLTETATT
jgi:hypothetical protein